MQKFDYSQINELEKFLYYSHIHDAKLESIEYIWQQNILKIDAVNIFHNSKISFAFYDIKSIFFNNVGNFGNRNEIISLTVEKLICLKEYLSCDTQKYENCLYLLFQTFSGDEIHILSRAVTITERERHNTE